MKIVENNNPNIQIHILDGKTILYRALELIAKQDNKDVKDFLIEAEAASNPTPMQSRALIIKQRLDRIISQN